MLRMAHRILSEGVNFIEDPRLFFGCDPTELIKRTISDNPVLLVDNCAVSVFSSEADRFTGAWEYPSIKCPFEELWCEYNFPEVYFSNEIKRSLRINQPEGEKCFTEMRKHVSQIGMAFHQGIVKEDTCRLAGVPVMTIDGKAIVIPMIFRVTFNSDGSLDRKNAHFEAPQETNVVTQLDIDMWQHWIAPILFALALCHAKNVTPVDVTNTEGPPEKWLSRQRQRKLTYRVLDIEPAKKKLREVGNSDSVGFAKALHICRGHFATYTEDKPLFGNVVGTFWKPSHVRGNIKNGAVVKDYSVSPSVEPE